LTRKRERQAKKKPAPPPPPEGYAARTKAQAHALEVIAKSTITFILGPAGTGKTHLASGYAVQQLIDGKMENIVITRPSVATEQLGYLPGSAEEKVGPYLVPFFDALERIAGKRGHTRDRIRAAVKIAPLAYLRGRSQPLDAKVLTPSGYKSMGEINVGDDVVGSIGLPTKVVGVYPQGELDVYRVTFSDGTSTECSEDHLWLTATRRQRSCGSRHSVRTTAEIKKTIASSGGIGNHSIPIASPVCFAEGAPLPTPPYTLGVLLGDGSLGAKGCVSISSADPMIPERVAKELPAGMVLTSSTLPNCAASQYRPVRPGGKRAKWTNPVKKSLQGLGLIGTSSSSKFIPRDYLLSSVSNRIALLQGLMDTDGTVYERATGTPRVLFRTTSSLLAGGVQFLVQSLGGTAIIKKYPPPKPSKCNGKMVIGRLDQYTVDIRLSEINPFYLGRKASRWRPHKVGRRIASIELIGTKPCQCIQVDAIDSLYLTDHCIVTHNTFNNSVMIFDEAQNANFGQLKLFLTRLGQGSQIIITGDADQSDLPRSERRLIDVMQRLSGLRGVGVVEFKGCDIVRNPIIEGVLRELEK
jgi:phosphate starvation-inducible PhoH-like protein